MSLHRLAIHSPLRRRHSLAAAALLLASLLAFAASLQLRQADYTEADACSGCSLVLDAAALRPPPSAWRAVCAPAPVTSMLRLRASRL